MPNRKKNFDEEAGYRLKRFRIEVLKQNQKELSSELNISQSKLSMLERGQVPDHEIFKFYAEKGIDWHWILTGEKIRKALPKNMKPKKNLLSEIEKDISDIPLVRFFRDIRKLEEIYEHVHKSEEYNQAEAEHYEYGVIEKIVQKVSILKNRMMMKIDLSNYNESDLEKIEPKKYLFKNILIYGPFKSNDGNGFYCNFSIRDISYQERDLNALNSLKQAMRVIDIFVK